MTTPIDDRYLPLSPHISADDAPAWALAASVAQDGLWFWDLNSDRFELSRRALDMLGREPTERVAGPVELTRHIHAEDAPSVRAALDGLRSGASARMEVEFRLLTRAGATRWTLIRARSRRGAGGEVTLVAGALSDIDQRKRASLAVRLETRLDPLTRLPNRIALMERLASRIARAAHTPLPKFAVLYLDLDRFKIVNDSLGHAYGDALLTEAAARLGAVLGPEDVLARVGGDEFVILLDEIDGVDSVSRITARLQDAMRPAIRLNHREVFTSASIGVRVSTDSSPRASDLLRDADVAMYRAKSRGGGQAMTFDPPMHHELLEKLRVQTEMHGALQREEFELVYQPIFDTADCRLCGFETFTRWNHPTRGRLTAADFMNAANESGLIVPIGRWVLRETCAQLSDWIARYPNSLSLSVSVNLCDRELLDPDFLRTVESALEDSGLPASRLVLEMSEGVMVSHSQAAVPALRRLRDQGVQIQMDNFGRGYSSLTTLRRMPISAIKIDRSLIVGVAADEELRALVATIAGYASALGLDVIAEGVETAEQAAVLATMGAFRYVQGNYFGRAAAGLRAGPENGAGPGE